MSKKTHDEELAKNYVLSEFKNTYYLGYRDIPKLVQKYVKGDKAIDYGCGTGRSTHFLTNLGLNTIGVDISKQMLLQASALGLKEHYLLIKHAKIPVLDNLYDLAFSCFVFFTISSKEKLLEILLEIYRILKPNGIFIIVTGSQWLYSKKWLSYSTKLQNPDRLSSGKKIKIHLQDININYINYHWSRQDYLTLFSQARFQLLEELNPLGSTNDPQPWINEHLFPPYTIYVLKKEN